MLLPVLILSTLVCLGAAVSFAFLDAWYLLWAGIIYYRWRLAGPKTKVLEESIEYSRVLPLHLDTMGHMNNGRYSRAAKYGRYSYMYRCGILQTIFNHKKTIMLTASSLRFRRTLYPGNRFAIRTYMLGWDDQSFYLEQQFINCRDGFVCAVVLAQHRVSGMSPSEVVQILYGRQVESPEIPEDVHFWLKCNQINRERLNNEVEESSKSK